MKLLDDETRRQIGLADCIFAYNQDAKQKALVFGHVATKPGTEQVKPARIFCLPVRSGTSDLDWLLAAVTQLKGHHDYDGTWGEPGEV